MLGNDVVDLEDVDARPETFRSRFDVRVFAEQERRAIAADEDSQACRWAHWGAKEASYKLARQIDPHFVFSPARLVAHWSPRSAATGERRGRLELVPGPGGRALAVELRSFETRDRVHVVARPAGTDWRGVVMAVEAIAGSDEAPGQAVRRVARRELARALGVDAARLSIGRRGRIPTVELDGRPTAHALSLSHHGRFVACAMAPADEPARALAEPARGESGAETSAAARGETDDGEGLALGGERAKRSAAGGRGRGVGQAIGFVGYPSDLAGTAWMAG